jgi:hypothetical protein
MAHVRSTAHPRDGAPESEDVIMERDAAGDSGDGGGSPERNVPVQESDANSHSGAGDNSDEGSRTRSYYFGPSMITVSHIREMIDHGYFVEGMGRVPTEETILVHVVDEAVIFEEFFTTGLRMPPHPVLSDILLKFQVQLHQLTPNANGQLSKCIWAVASFGGVPSTDSFTKRYEFHYQSKKMTGDEAEVLVQYGCVNFCAKHYGGQGARLTVAVKNKGTVGWTQVWFRCKVPLLW